MLVAIDVSGAREVRPEGGKTRHYSGHQVEIVWRQSLCWSGDNALEGATVDVDCPSTFAKWSTDSHVCGHEKMHSVTIMDSQQCEFDTILAA